MWVYSRERLDFSTVISMWCSICPWNKPDWLGTILSGFIMVNCAVSTIFFLLPMLVKYLNETKRICICRSNGCLLPTKFWAWHHIDFFKHQTAPINRRHHDQSPEDSPQVTNIWSNSQTERADSSEHRTEVSFVNRQMTNERKNNISVIVFQPAHASKIGFFLQELYSSSAFSWF